MTYLEYLDTPEGSALAKLRWNVGSAEEWRSAENHSAPPVPFYAYAEGHGWPGLRDALRALRREPTPLAQPYTCAECGRQFNRGEAFNPATGRFCWWS